MKKTVLEKINSELTYFDGGMGTLLQQAGLSLGELPERWNLTHPDVVKQIHTDYLAAGADIIKTNTFGANALKFSDSELEEIVLAGMRLAKEAVTEAGRGYIALDIGPCGKLLKPYGDLEFEQAVALFAKTVKIGAPHADCVLIETMNDAYETKAAVLAVKENCNLPVFVTNVYGADGKLMTGADPKAMIALLEGLRVDALGLNCSLGIEQMLPLLPTFYQYSSLPIIVNPNAGLPKEEDGKTYYDTDEERFSTLMQEAVKAGARVIGGCCGTTPKFIEKTVQKTKNVAPMPVTNKNYTLISSYTHAVEFAQKTVLIGERINPTGKKRFKQALRENDVNYVLQTDAVTLTVFDMAEFFRRNSFAAGDALLCTVEDHTAGVVSFEYLSAASRPAAERSAYIAALEESATKVWRKFQDYLDIPEQLAWIMFLAKVSGGAPGASLDEFMAGSAKVQLRPEGDHAVLAVAGEDDDAGHDDDCGCGCGGHDHDHDRGSELPAGLALTEDEIDDPLKLLSEAGFPLSLAELDGFMLDAIYGRESEFDGVRSRVFGHAEFDFEDEVKQAVLLNFLEERFETLRDNYNRADDESKAELRSQIMESVSRRLDYLAALGAAEHDPGEAEKERMRRLADVAAKLGEALRLLNHPGFTPDRRELDRLGELIDDQISRQEEIIGDTEADQ